MIIAVQEVELTDLKNATHYAMDVIQHRLRGGAEVCS
jgi:hypothetical protein